MAKSILAHHKTINISKMLIVEEYSYVYIDGFDAKRQPDQVSITYNNVIVHGLLGMFLKDNFGEETVTRARDWLIDHVPGQNWNADKIIKLMCRWTGKTPFLEINKWADFCEKHKKQNKNQNNS